jgi:hypothetical protein
MNFDDKFELETYLEKDRWEKIPTYEVGIRAETFTHWYKLVADVKPHQRLNSNAPIQICVLVYDPPEAPGQELVSIHLTAEKHDGEWIKFEVYSIGLQSLTPQRLQIQIDDLISAWKSVNQSV